MKKTLLAALAALLSLQAAPALAENYEVDILIADQEEPVDEYQSG